MDTIVIIPCFKVKYKILNVIKKSLEYFDLLICVDDCCPENSGDHILKNIKSERVIVIKHSHNKGVGGALKTGFKYASKFKPRVIVKLDGDNQIYPNDAKGIADFLIKSDLDYIVGSRFKLKNNSKNIPIFRWYGNRLISFISKISSGLYHMDDFLNGLIAIKFKQLKKLKVKEMKDDFLFETDLLFKISDQNLKTSSYPMKIKYFKNNSNFNPTKEFLKFMIFNLKNFILRIIKSYFLKDIKLGSFLIMLFLFFSFAAIKDFFMFNFIFNINSSLAIYFLSLFFVIDVLEKKGQ